MDGYSTVAGRNPFYTGLSPKIPELTLSCRRIDGHQRTSSMAPAVRITGSRPAPGDLLSPQELFHLKVDSAWEDQGSSQLIIDLRPRSRYRRRHIPGSHSIPSGWLISGEPPDGELILVGGSTLHSTATIEQLHAQGYARRIRHLAGGFEAWQQQELPVASHQGRGFPFPGNPRRLLAVGHLLFSPWVRRYGSSGLMDRPHPRFAPRQEA